MGKRWKKGGHKVGMVEHRHHSRRVLKGKMANAEGNNQLRLCVPTKVAYSYRGGAMKEAPDKPQDTAPLSTYFHVMGGL
jgi:hypothetical protein